MRDPVIELEDVAIAFGGKRVLDGVDLTIDAGETTFIVGRSGSGKTVLLKIMLGLVIPDRGRVRLFGHDLATVSPVELLALRKRTAMLFQTTALFDALSVAENVEFPLLEASHVPAPEAEQRALELLRTLGLAGSERALPAELSGGMKKRVALARALVTGPEVVLLDEPATGLDPVMVAQVDRMIAFAKRTGATPVVVSHDMASARRIADRVAFLHEGRIAFTGSYGEFAACELAPIRAFFSEASPRQGGVAAAGAPVIELVGVHKSFGAKHVLRGVDLAIAPHRITVLIGASGSGKSVIAKHIMGMMKPDRGEILVGGKDIVAMPEHELATVRERFALVFQHSGLLDWLSVEDNVAFPLVESRHQRGSPAAIRERVDEMLAQLDLLALRHRMPGELSVGERKRVALARAMVTRPDVLIYDEPTTGQDPMRAHEIDDLIVDMQRKFGVTTLVISHDMASTFRIAHVVAMLQDGRIVASGAPVDLLASTSSSVREFIAAAGQR